MTVEGILITGGTGFIGRNVVRRLTERGTRPVLICRDREKAAEFADVADIFEIDLFDHKAVSEFVRNFKPDTVLHLGGTAFRDTATATLNFEASRNLLDSAAETGVGRFILLGSADEYGPQEIPFRETMTAMPNSAYAISRVRVTDHAMNLSAAKKLPATVLRVFTAYGPGQPDAMFLNQVIKHGLAKKAFNMTKGTQRRDMVFIEDVAEAVIKAAEAADIGGRIINIGSGTSMRLADAARAVWQLCGADDDLLIVGGRPVLDGEGHDTEADISLANELLDWRPAVTFEEGSVRTVSRMKATMQQNG